MSLKNQAVCRISDSDKESDGEDDPDWVVDWKKGSSSSTPVKKVDEVYDDKQDRRRRQLLKSGPFKGAASGSKQTPKKAVNFDTTEEFDADEIRRAKVSFTESHNHNN